MVSRYADEQSRPHPAVQNDGASENEENEAESFHEGSTEDALDVGTVLESPAVSPERFFARLRSELAARGFDYDKLPRLTYGLSPPPCFAMAGVPYGPWLASASLLGATVPYRYDMPAEPNYCFDCRAAFKQKAQAVGACNFPNTKFERAQTVIREESGKTLELEVVGVSRSQKLIFTSPEDDDNA